MRIDVDDRFSTEDAIYLAQKMADARKGTAFIVSHGWIIDGLVVARYEQPVISLLNSKRPLTIIVLEEGDEIKAVTGENCHFQGTRVVGKIEVETMNGVKYGPFGYSGTPGYQNQGLIFSYFNT